MFLYLLVAIGGVIIIGREVGRALFLSQLLESATPYKYILPPLIVVPLLGLYTRLVPRYRPARLMYGSGLLMAAGIFVFRLLLETALGEEFIALAGLFIYLQLLGTLVGIQFWTYANDIFTPREARRLFGLIAAGGTLANVLAGTILQVAARTVVPKDLLFIVAGGLLSSVVLVVALERRRVAEVPDGRSVPASPAASTKEDTSLCKGLGAILSSRLLLTASALMLIMSVVTNISEYQLDLSLQRSFVADAAGMIAFLGVFNLLTGALAIFVQFFVTGRLLSRLGLVAGLLVLPLAIGAGSIGLIVTGGMLWAAAVPRGADNAVNPFTGLV
jgi:hypothetical protein